MNICALTYTTLRALVRKAIDLYQSVTKWWQECSRQSCRWWCLCCNKWLCWIALIICYVLVTIWLLVVVIIGVALVTTCWVTCSLLFLFSFGGNFGRSGWNCFAGDPAPPDPVPVPTVRITEPGEGIPARYYTPTELIRFTAVGEDGDGSALTGSSLQWTDSYPGTVDASLGEGEELSVYLPLRPEDESAGRVTEHLVSVVATGSDGRKSRPARASVNVLKARID